MAANILVEAMLPDLEPALSGVDDLARGGWVAVRHANRKR
jgi:hypothetical protein